MKLSTWLDAASRSTLSLGKAHSIDTMLTFYWSYHTIHIVCYLERQECYCVNQVVLSSRKSLDNLALGYSVLYQEQILQTSGQM